MLGVGDKAPNFKLASTGGEEVDLYEACSAHRAVILAFYVLDFTPG